MHSEEAKALTLDNRKRRSKVYEAALGAIAHAASRGEFMVFVDATDPTPKKKGYEQEIDTLIAILTDDDYECEIIEETNKKTKKTIKHLKISWE
jgi:hypothetical protein